MAFTVVNLHFRISTCPADEDVDSKSNRSLRFLSGFKTPSTAGFACWSLPCSQLEMMPPVGKKKLAW